MKEIKVSLTAEDFQQLVMGHIIKPKLTNLSYEDREEGTVVKIALQDIGWDKITSCVVHAMQDSSRYREPLP